MAAGAVRGGSREIRVPRRIDPPPGLGRVSADRRSMRSVPQWEGHHTKVRIFSF